MISRSKHIEDTKGLLGFLPTVKAPIPDKLFLATDNARCKQGELFVNEGDHVYLGQVIGMRHAAFFDQPIHATCSGRYIGKEKHYHRSGKLVDFLVLENDHKDEWDPSIKERSEEEVSALKREDFVEILKNHASVGLGGSSFPTYIKFQTKAKINTILINGIECEPYLSADNRAMMEFSDEVVKGMMLLEQAFDCHDCRLCFKGKHTKLTALYNNLFARHPGSGLSVCLMDDYFPQGWELKMIKKATGIEVPQGKLPSEYGIMDFNVSTMIGIYRSVTTNKPVVERLISVNGDGIAFPSNFRVRVGTPIKGLIDYCGGYVNPEIRKVVILGGPMMGASIPSDDCIVTKTVTSAIILNETIEKEEPCIRCGSCVMSCPAGLMPVSIMKAVKANDKTAIKELNPLKCIECGLCTYTCTSKIHVTNYIRRAKIFAKM